MHSPAIDSEISAALELTRRFGFGDNHSLCHGDIGNLELLQLARERTRYSDSSADLDHAISAILHVGERDGWRCGAPFDIEIPGLMTGLAGIGYGLLRAAQPSRVASVLLLASPDSEGSKETRGHANH